MRADPSGQLDPQRKLAEFSYEPIRNIRNLSPYHQRVIMQKKYLQKKQKLRSILIMGHLKKMQLNAINNKSIETMRKCRVAEQMSKKRHQSVDQGYDSNSQVILKIDNRKKTKLRMKTQTNQLIVNQRQNSQQIQKTYDKLIDDYLKQVSKQKLLEKGMDRQKVIDEACSIIKTQMVQQISSTKVKQENSQKDQQILTEKRTLSNSEQNINLPSINKIKSNKKPQLNSDRLLQISTRQNIKSLDRDKKNDTSLIKVKPSQYNNRSVVQIQCADNLKKLQLEQKYLSKQRIREEKLFLRKMKLIGIKNIRTMRCSLDNS